MSRIAVLTGLLCGLLLILAPGSSAQQRHDPTALPRLLDVMHQIQPEFPEIPADPQTKLESMLSALSARFSRPQDTPPFQLVFDINVKAFKEEKINAVGDTAIVAERGLRKECHIGLGDYLLKILARIPATSGATFLYRKDCIEITTTAALRKEIWGKDYSGPFLPLITDQFDKRSLESTLQILGEQAGHSVILDPRVGASADTRVSGRFLNTPLDTAVTLVADMADLRMVHTDNVLYVTTRENALRFPGRKR